ncbi:MAG: ferrous iron transport protein A [Desulfovibrionaceae bacterium]|jgi:ferrous iron transport protein A|nr:ferrous iron transport protein A [Desulfovibrionaceae bacterium]
MIAASAPFLSGSVLDAVDALPLNALRQGARATIVRLGAPQDEGEHEVLLRLIEIGFLPGETVRVVARAAGGREPVAVRLGGQSTFALRRREAELVRVQPEGEGGETA